MKYQPSACDMRFKMSAFIPQSLYICIVDAVYTFYSRERERERERLNELPKLILQLHVYLF